jgi:elongation factor G
MVEKVEEWREKLIETAVEQDDDLMEAYLEGNEPSVEDIKRCIRKGTRKLDFFPTYCGSAFKNKGIQLVLDAVVDYLPSSDRSSNRSRSLTWKATKPAKCHG